MEELKEKAVELTDSVSEYIKTYYKLSVLNVTDKATTIAALSVTTMVVAFLGFFVLLFSGIALGIWLGQLLNSLALGYLLVAGLYLLIIIVVIALRKRIVFPMIRNLIIDKIYE
ncbi:MAG: phage holin family protein [Flavitalea sp.]